MVFLKKNAEIDLSCTNYFLIFYRLVTLALGVQIKLISYLHLDVLMENFIQQIKIGHGLLYLLSGLWPFLPLIHKLLLTYT